jgi:hypothetical protein
VISSSEDAAHAAEIEVRIVQVGPPPLAHILASFGETAFA